MVLKDYLAKNGIKLSDMAALTAFGERFTPQVTAHAVRKWARGERLPRLGALKQIEKITEGKVLATDFTADQKAA